MAGKRKHRGPHPQDQELFAETELSRLQLAAADLSWLLGRGYALPSSGKLVGDRYALATRQRIAVRRAACGVEQAQRRQARQTPPGKVDGATLWIDGFNVLTSVEAALAGGVILHCRDGCYRDMASMHGSYRTVEETRRAIEAIGEVLGEVAVGRCHWLLDAPVSNSGRLKSLLLAIAAERGWAWDAEVVPDPDRLLRDGRAIAASADSQILDGTACWFNLAREVIDRRADRAWIVDLS